MRLLQKASLIFRSKKGPKVEKGVAFPVCLSVNNCVCHYSPLASDESVSMSPFTHHYDCDYASVEGIHVTIW
jgi:hypothetical protein